jgi:competence protein ComEC
LPASARRIDLMVLTHPQDDHVTGLVSVLERYDVKAALTTPLPGRTAAHQAWRESLAAHSVPVRTAAAGQWIGLGGGTRIEVLGPPARLLEGTDDDVNNSSVVLRLVYGAISFLLMGDLAAQGEQALLAGGAEVHATVLKVGHHGSDGSSKPAFVSAVQPRLAVISVGADNAYGHPSPSTRLALSDLPVLRTDHNGDIRLGTDGKRLSVYLQRGRAKVTLPGTVK